MICIGIYICDAPMGSGKTSAAIQYINDNPDKRFLFVTPYLKETERIMNACPEANFVLPDNWENNLGVCRKLDYVQLCLARGDNVATTHVLFRLFTKEILESIKQFGYTLILDEVLQVMDAVKIKKSDWNMLQSVHAVEIDSDQKVHWKLKEYEKNAKFSYIKENAEAGHLYQCGSGMFLTVADLTPFLIFREVFILTYMFNAQDQRALFQVQGIPFSYIGIKHEDNNYWFSHDRSELANHLKGIKKRIHILEDQKSNQIGTDINALSSNFYNKDRLIKEKPNHKILKRNIYRVKRRIWNVKSSEVMWTCLKASFKHIKTYGLENSNFIACNARATNEYANRTHLLYLMNVYRTPLFKNYFLSKGVRVNDDDYAISEMVQWIWRSAIRKGEEIWLYVPSSRMRGLLKDWLDQVS